MKYSRSKEVKTRRENLILENKIKDQYFTFRSAYAENSKAIYQQFFSEKNNNKSVKIHGVDTGLNSYKNLTYEPPFTFYSDKLVCTVDYIFYSGEMTIAGIYDIPNISNIIKTYKYLPNKHYGSDHFCIAADFILI